MFSMFSYAYLALLCLSSIVAALVTGPSVPREQLQAQDETPALAEHLLLQEGQTQTVKSFKPGQSIAGGDDDDDEDDDDDDDIENLLIIDGHNDFAIWTRAFYNNRIYQENFTETSELYGQVDFPRLTAGRSGAQFWSVYVECPRDWAERDFDDSVYYENIHDTLQQIDLVKRMLAAFPSHLQPAHSAAQVLQQHREYVRERKVWLLSQYGRHVEDQGIQQQQQRLGHASSPPPVRRVSSLLGVEGLHQIGNSASILRQYHALGVRYATLTHTCHNAYADSEEPAEPAHGGLSARGVAMVREMNRLGMMVDLSHTSARTQRAALAATRAPVLFTHSNARTLYNHSRNVDDGVLRALRANGGVAMATFYPQFLSDEPEAASIDDVADHIVYMGELIGYEHVGIGSDFDGMAHGPRGLEDVGKYPALVAELRRRGVRGRRLAGVMGLNVMRVLAEVERVAAELSRTELPLEDRVKPFFDHDEL